jgi:hypothetical protein
MPLPLPSDQSPDLPHEEETPTEDEEVPEVEGPKVNRGTLDLLVEMSRKDSSTPLDLTASESVRAPLDWIRVKLTDSCIQEGSQGS